MSGATTATSAAHKPNHPSSVPHQPTIAKKDPIPAAIENLMLAISNIQATIKNPAVTEFLNKHVKRFETINRPPYTEVYITKLNRLTTDFLAVAKMGRLLDRAEEAYVALGKHF